MTTWNEYRQLPASLSQADINLIDTLSFLQASRIKQYISQKDLGKKIGMSQSQIARLENLDVMPTLSILQKYASGLGFTISLSVVPV